MQITSEPDCRGWTGHVIVCGLHGVGLRTVEQLHLAAVRVVVVDDDPDPRLARVVRTWGVPHVVGSSRLAETLHEAGLAGALALICVESDDLHTLETALLTRELRPDVRIVVQLNNPAVGRAITEVTGVGSVLDVAALAAPSIVEACLGRPVHELELGGRHFLVAQVPVPYPGTLRSVFGTLVPIAVSPSSGGDLVLFPGRDHRVAHGDVVAVLGTPEELDDADVAWREGKRNQRVRPPVRPGRSWPNGKPGPTGAPAGPGVLRYLTGSMLHLVDRRLPAAFGVLLTLVAVSSTVLTLTYRDEQGRMSPLDGLYFTVETIGTVGYGDFSFRQQSPWLRVFAICLMIFGATLATLFFALLTNLMVSRRIEEQLGRRRVPGMTGHVIVIGIGSVGERVVEGLLARGRQVVVVERDEDNRYLAQVRALGVPVIVGDSTLEVTLEAANLAAAGAVAVLTSDDLTNLETGLAIRDQLGTENPAETPVVLRLFDRQLATTVERSFGFGHVRSTAALAAPWFVGAALGLDVLGTFYVGRRPILVGRLTVATGGGLDGVAMQDLGATIRVVAIARAGEIGLLEHPPRRGTVLRGGDQAYLVGPYEELLRVLRRDSPAFEVPLG